MSKTSFAKERAPQALLGIDRVVGRMNPLGRLCLLFLVVLFVAGLFAPYITSHSPIALNVTQKFAGPSWEHLLGTDHLGRDILARLLYGIRATLWVAFCTTFVTVIIGMILGAWAGFKGGRYEEVCMRICDVCMSFPSEILILAIVGMLGPGIENVVLACVIAKWPWYTRMICSFTKEYAQAGYVRYAKVAGYSSWSIVKRHLLPRLRSDTLVLFTLDLGSVMLMFSALSFLGLGTQPPTPEWGLMLAEARQVMVLQPWVMLPPGIAILSVVAACNYLGDCLGDALNVHRLDCGGEL